MAKAKAFDFTNVKDGGGSFSKTNVPEGDYVMKVTKVEEAPAKSDKTPQWVFTIVIKDKPSASYPYYVKHQENQLWKLRNLLIAAGMNVPKKKVNVDPDKIVGKLIGASLEDAEWNDRMQSEIASVFPATDVESNTDDDDDDDEDVDDTEPDEEEADDVDDDEDEEEPEPPKKKAKASKKKAKKPADDVDDDELEELDIEDI